MAMNYSRAILRRPCKNIINGITSSALGRVDYRLAIKQHESYCDALMSCGLEIQVLEANEGYPDSTFIEDTAVLAKECAVLARPGASSRRGEIDTVREAVSIHYGNIRRISHPGTLDGGDVMIINDMCFVGTTERTNEEGAGQLASILAEYGINTAIIPVNHFLHLKTAVNYLDEHTLILTKELAEIQAFKDHEKIIVDDNEAYSANCLSINGRIIVPRGYSGTLAKLENAGYETIMVDVSEFRKLDGGLTCLSLRF